jgi:hypothetical protein
MENQNCAMMLLSAIRLTEDSSFKLQRLSYPKLLNMIIIQICLLKEVYLPIYHLACHMINSCLFSYITPK